LKQNAGGAPAGEAAAREFDTPAFMPVGTQATVKALSPTICARPRTRRTLKRISLISAAGHETIEKLGGVQKFMGWDGLMLTDSGGYQIFSLKG